MWLKFINSQLITTGIYILVFALLQLIWSYLFNFRILNLLFILAFYSKTISTRILLLQLLLLLIKLRFIWLTIEVSFIKIFSLFLNFFKKLWFFTQIQINICIRIFIASFFIALWIVFWRICRRLPFLINDLLNLIVYLA